MQGAVVHLAGTGARITRSADLPLEALLIGRPVEEAAELLPRLFNLCRMAQGTAARLALGLAGAEGDPTAEILHDHAAKIFVTLRRSFGLPPVSVPASLTPQGLFGPAGVLPDTLTGLQDWLRADLPAAALARQIVARFAKGVACAPALPEAPTPLARGAYENSAALRQADLPLMRAIERQGRGPLWRYMGMLADAGEALAGRLPPPQVHGDLAVVQAARGAYALRITQAQGRVTGLQRQTPTDHILAQGGALEQALSGLEPALAPLVIALHDPCVPVTVQETLHA